jgi:hypothetical protein
VRAFISTHHGTTLAAWFYNRYLDEGGDPSEEALFRYSGELPQTREQIILMLCDSLEAASRSLKDYSPQTLSDFVEGIVAGKMEQGQFEKADITVGELPEGQAWLKSFKVKNDTYYLSLVNPTDWQTGKNIITAYVSKKNTPATTPYGLAEEQFTIEIDPRMPDMGNHTSPDNVALTRQADGSYQGTVNLTMTGRWRIHLTVKDEDGNVVAGGDDLSDGYSSLYWEVTI